MILVGTGFEVRIEKRRSVMAATQSLFPQLAGLLAEHAREQEDEKPLQRGKDGKEDLECQSKFLYCHSEGAKHPRETKEGHDSSSADQESYNSFAAYTFLPASGLVQHMPDEDRNHDGTDDRVEQNDDENGPQECHEEYYWIAEKAAGKEMYIEFKEEKLVTCGRGLVNRNSCIYN